MSLGRQRGEAAGVASIFISYRREDSAGYAGRLCDRLNSLLGGDSVFMDVEDIQPGEDFTRAIQQKLASCKFVIAVIGPRWLASMKERPDGREDFVRRELTAALKLKRTVIPVLVGGARMPEPGDLPPELAPLSRRNAVEISDTGFDEDVKRLTGFLRETSSRPDGVRRRWWLASAAAILAVTGITAYLALRPAQADISGKWTAEMHKAGQRPFRIELTFEVSGGSVLGTVTYPTGTGTIQDGKVIGRRLTFVTRHVSDVDNEPVSIRYQGEITSAEIRLTSTDNFGVAKGVATKEGR